MPVTRADEMDALAERVERLTGADRPLDIEIAKALGLMGPYANWPEGSYLPPDACCFTSSLDAAMSLVPEETEWLLARTLDPHEDNRPHYYASIAEAQVHYGATPALSPPADRREIVATKPHKGRITGWLALPCQGGLGYYIIGTFLEHPDFGSKETNTSYIVKHDKATGEIETRNSRYTLIAAIDGGR